MVDFPAPPVEGAVGALTLVSAWARCGAAVTLCVFPNDLYMSNFVLFGGFQDVHFSLDCSVFL